MRSIASRITASSEDSELLHAIGYAYEPGQRIQRCRDFVIIFQNDHATLNLTGTADNLSTPSNHMRVT